MAVQLHEIQNPYGVVEMKGVDIVSFKEKPVTRSYINAGVYAISPSSLTLLEPQQFCDMPTLFTRIKNHKGKVVAYPMHEQWLDVGRPEDLLKANNGNFFNVTGESE
jgi:NDP-sugar pyrophosphorylase family protein